MSELNQLQDIAFNLIRATESLHISLKEVTKQELPIPNILKEAYQYFGICDDYSEGDIA